MAVVVSSCATETTQKKGCSNSTYKAYWHCSKLGIFRSLVFLIHLCKYNKIFFLFFSRKQDFTFHANCLLRNLVSLIYFHKYDKIFFLFFLENRIWHFMQIISLMSNLFSSWKKKKWEKYSSMLSFENLTQHAIKTLKFLAHPGVSTGCSRLKLSH